MWALARFLPVMVGEHIPEDDEKWNNFLVLLHITDFLVAPKISVDEIAYLKILIEDHHSTFVRNYQETTIPAIIMLTYVM